MHRPSTQPSSPHFLPQVPQLFGSLPVFTQAPEQAASPALQEMPHWLLMHVAVPPLGALQACPHCPQLATSLLASTQRPEHGMNPALHWKEQTPLLQRGAALVGGVHTVPHFPQLDASVCKSTHEPEQVVCVPQSVPHLPPWHT